MSKMSPVVHFEMAAEDRKRMADFYTKVFGWKAEMLGPDMGNYVVVRTSETDEKGHPKTLGNIGGGFYQKMEDPDMNHPSVIIAVEDLNDSISKVKKSGGKILGDPADIPGIGRYVSFKDTEGNRVGMLQPLMQM